MGEDRCAEKTKNVKQTHWRAASRLRSEDIRSEGLHWARRRQMLNESNLMPQNALLLKNMKQVFMTIGSSAGIL